MIPRKKRNSSKVNLTISAVFHGLLILAVFIFAAREGILAPESIGKHWTRGRPGWRPAKQQAARHAEDK